MEHIDVLRQIKCIDGIQTSMNCTVQALYEDNLFQLKLLKDKRNSILKDYYSKRVPRKIFLTHRLQKLVPFGYEELIEILPIDFFTSLDGVDEKSKLIAGSIVFANNNDVHNSGNTQIFEELIKLSTTTIFCGWDWDNHHWLSLSCKFSGSIDFYFPSHNENLYQLLKFNDLAGNVIPCGTVQWPSRYIIDNFSKILSKNRCDELLGMHIYYEFFKYRTAVIQKVSESSPKVGFVSHEFHNLSDAEKLNQWIMHKAHLIVPVLNDVPIRVFDSWSTGGIPIVPKSLKSFFEPFNIYADDICYYSSSDVLKISDKLNEAVIKFNKHGEGGVRRRMLSGLYDHHGDRRLRDMISLCAQEYNLKII